MIVVADTGPINYLILIGNIDVLSVLYGSVVIPSAVHAELNRQGAPPAVRQWIATPPSWLLIRTPSDQSPDPDLDGPGEREAIALAKELHADEILIDEIEARRVAKRRGLSVTGTLGVLLKAADNGLLDLNESIDRLIGTSFYATPELLDRMRKNAK